MSNLQAVPKEILPEPWTDSAPRGTPLILRWVIGTLLACLIGTWLVWFSAYVQRKFQEEDIRAACQRVMPDTAGRCFDTVIIQRGGVRR